MRPLFLSLCLLGGVAAAKPCPTLSSWPTSGFPSAVSETAAKKADAIKAFEDYAFTLTGKDPQRIGVRTDAVLIIQHGVLLYERYARGFTPAMRHEGWSVSKSITSALVGIGVQRGVLSVSDSVCRYLPTTKPATTCSITLLDLLEFASGLDWEEEYENGSNQSSSVIAMLYGEGRHDMAAFVGSHPLRAPPGTTFHYSTGDITLLSSAVDEAFRASLGEQYPWTALFNPLGMTSAAFERDSKGHTVGGAGFYATPVDYAKFGYLYLQDGCWNNERILPEGWVTSSTALSTPFLATPSPDGAQGRCWWINQPVPSSNIPKPYPDLPDDFYTAIGHWGQYVMIVPSRDAVIVRLGDDRDSTFSIDTFAKLALEIVDP